MRKMAQLAIDCMTQPRNKIGLAVRFGCIFSDVHFWVPLAVLIAGLLILAWVS